MRIVHVITGLGTGGAETMLYRLLAHTDRTEFEPRVISLTDVGPVGDRIRDLGVPVEALGMRRGVPNPGSVFRLARRLGEIHPHAVQTWMYQADLIGGLAARMAGAPPVAWGIHSTHLDPQKVSRIKLWTVRLCAWTSRWIPHRIVCCSQTSREFHADLGYPKDKMLVIPNGADLQAFRPDLQARAALCAELGLPEDTLLVGLMARFDPQKDHRNFVRAAALLHGRLPGAHFVLCGDGITPENRELVSWIGTGGLREKMHLLGRRRDVPRITAALDVATSSSAYGEAWPLVVGEAMACGVPCTVTDVGDSAAILGDTGRVVPPRDPEALADALHELLTLSPEEKARLGRAARRRVEEHFSLQDAVFAYEALYRELGWLAER